MFHFVAKEYLEASILDPYNTQEFATLSPEEPSPEQIEDLAAAREGAARLSWKPYMHYPALPHLLHRLKRLPTLLVWGKDDQIVPLSAADVYHESIEGSQLAILNNCGHRPELEKTEEFVDLVRKFLADD